MWELLTALRCAALILKLLLVAGLLVAGCADPSYALRKTGCYARWQALTNRGDFIPSLRWNRYRL